ncbi:hypothetical protein [Pontibacter arcticus]|uniref:hypothetical protein n=1 Tax=Pontibacter arcticus TaxID=2080288 RepID=UPI000F61BCDE|nr:hypothetical protein [Pontibacter arcticus]
MIWLLAYAAFTSHIVYFTNPDCRFVFSLNVPDFAKLLSCKKLPIKPHFTFAPGCLSKFRINFLNMRCAFF